MNTQKKKYSYNYPAQKELAKRLLSGEREYIAAFTPYTLTTFNALCNGTRKMPDYVKEMIEKTLELRKQSNAAMEAIVAKHRLSKEVK